MQANAFVVRRQDAITGLLDAIREYRNLADQPLTLRGSEYAHAQSKP
jgi:hypothetical protein